MSYLTGIYPEFVAIYDLNNDTHMDIVVTDNVDNGNVEVILGFGDDSFASRETNSTGNNAGCMRVRVSSTTISS